MAGDAKIYLCEKCGNIAGMIVDNGCVPSCCGTPMKQLPANTTDAAVEKHVPVVSVNGNKISVKVGSTAHPMTEEHYIQWIIITTEKGRQRKTLNPGEEPAAVFELTDDDKFVSAEAYCNLHGLWKA